MKNVTGIHPYEYVQIVRAESAIARLFYADVLGIDVQDIIYETGYYDQAHFIREIKKTTGYTPMKLTTAPGFESLRGVMSSRIFKR